MSNVIQFTPTAAQPLDRDIRGEFLADPSPPSHAVQFYDSSSFLADTVAGFLAAGLRAGEPIAVIATPDHRRAFLERLGEQVEVERAVAEGELLMLDAEHTLAKFMVAGTPDPDLFRDALARVLGALKSRRSKSRVRLYGEMVDLLWKDGNSRAAIRLEELWDDAVNQRSLSLLCAYKMGHFYKEGDADRFMEVCRNHSHVIPTESFSHLDDPHARLREISLLQQRARMLEAEIAHRKQLEEALRDALRERVRAEEDLRECVRREREARERAEASDSYKEMFVGILGHDLRNPLNTILTTARMMKLRRELPAEGDRRLDRLLSSGVRMERMIAQLLDVTRARLSDGIPVTREREHDLAAIVRKIVDELRGAHPERRIDVQADGPCLVHLDPDRFEQVVSNLAGNAIAHGDPARPITIVTAVRPGVASLSVHNFGAPIPPALLPVLFNPFRRHEQREGRPEGLGLGLGLYIAERIVSAHGGTIEVSSHAEEGTRFEIVLPVSSKDV